VGDGRNRARRLDESIFADFTPMGRTGAPGCRPATPSSSQPAHVPASHSSRFDRTLLAEQSIDVYVEDAGVNFTGWGKQGDPVDTRPRTARTPTGYYAGAPGG
jgi:hypothetical protein